MVWFAEFSHGAARALHVYDIEVDADLRGKGDGEAIMRELGDRALAMGVATVKLHVFGNNTVARSLYTKLGYIETNVSMAKTLRPAGSADTRSLRDSDGSKKPRFGH